MAVAVDRAKQVSVAELNQVIAVRPDVIPAFVTNFVFLTSACLYSKAQQGQFQLHHPTPPIPGIAPHPPPPHLPTSSPAAGLLALSQATLAAPHPLAHAAAAAAAKEEVKNIDAGWQYGSVSLRSEVSKRVHTSR